MPPIEPDVDRPPASAGAEVPATGSQVEPPYGARREARRPRPVFLLIGVVLATALGIGLFTSVGTSHRAQTAVVGGTVPAFTLSRLGGGAEISVPAGGESGKPAILLFFASWCGPCQHEVPTLASTYRHQQATGSKLAKVAVIGIDDLDPTASALTFVHHSGVTFPVGVDKSGTVTNGLFQLTGLPDSVFVEANGTIAGIHQGGLTSSELVSWERKLLKTA